MTSKPIDMTTEQWMRALADAVGQPNGVRFQPISPSTLRDWADEIERLRVECRRLRGVERLFHKMCAASGAAT